MCDVTKGAENVTDEVKVAPGIYRRGSSLLVKVGYTDRFGNRRRAHRTVADSGETPDMQLIRARLVQANIKNEVKAGTFEDQVPEVVPRGLELQMSVNSLIDRYLASGETRWRANTKTNYAQLLGKVRDLPIGKMEIGKVDRQALEDMRNMLALNGESDSGLRKVRTMLSQAFEYALDGDWISHNPVPRLKNLPKPDKPHFSIPDQAVILEVLNDIADRDPDFGCMLFVVLATGMRRGEVAALRWTNINWDADEIQVQSQYDHAEQRLSPLKTPSSRRIIEVDKATMKRLRAQQKRQAARSTEPISQLAFIFAPFTRGSLAKKGQTKRVVRNYNRDAMRPYHGEYLSKKWARARKNTDLAAMKFHDFRHAHASLLLSNGAPIPAVSKRLGHADVATTLRVYSHVMPGDGRRLADMMGNYLSDSDK